MIRASRTFTRVRGAGASLLLWAVALVGCSGSDGTSPTELSTSLQPLKADAPAAMALGAKAAFHAPLSAEAPGVESRATGLAWVELEPGATEGRFRLNMANIVDVTMAHIHVAAAPGANGPPAVWLYPSAPPPHLIPGRFQGVLSTGSFDASSLVGPLAGGDLSDLRQAIVDGRAYVNVHTTQYPGGEIRGTLR